MKVERKETEVFQPITITLETEEEAKKMWLVLHTSTDVMISKVQRFRVPLDNPSMADMRVAYDKVFGLMSRDC